MTQLIPIDTTNGTVNPKIYRHFQSIYICRLLGCVSDAGCTGDHKVCNKDTSTCGCSEGYNEDENGDCQADTVIGKWYYF